MWMEYYLITFTVMAVQWISLLVIDIFLIVAFCALFLAMLNCPSNAIANMSSTLPGFHEARKLSVIWQIQYSQMCTV